MVPQAHQCHKRQPPRLTEMSQVAQTAKTDQVVFCTLSHALQKSFRAKNNLVGFCSQSARAPEVPEVRQVQRAKRALARERANLAKIGCLRRPQRRRLPPAVGRRNLKQQGEPRDTARVWRRASWLALPRGRTRGTWPGSGRRSWGACPCFDARRTGRTRG